jgi:hypothetical protein
MCIWSALSASLVHEKAARIATTSDSVASIPFDAGFGELSGMTPVVNRGRGAA